MLASNENGARSAKPIATADKSHRFWRRLLAFAKPAVKTAPRDALSQATVSSAPEKSASIMTKPARKTNEVAELVNALRNHIEQQSDRSERLLAKMEGLPAALESLPQTSQIGERMLTTMRRHIELQQNHSERLVQVIEDMSDASKHRDQTIDILQRQITAAQEKDVKFMSGFQTMSQTMSEISDVQAESASMLQRIAETANQAEKRMGDVIDNSRRHAWTGLISVGAMAVALLAMSAFVALSFSQNQSSQPTAVNPPVPETTAQPTVASPPSATVDASLTEPGTPDVDAAADTGQVAPAPSADASAETDSTAMFESLDGLPSVALDQLAKTVSVPSTTRR